MSILAAQPISNPLDGFSPIEWNRMSDKAAVVSIRKAGGGLAVIVFGVLIALAADEWMQAREDRGRADDLVQRLMVEVREDSLGLETFLSLSGAAAAAGARLIEELEGGTPVPADSLPQLVRSISSPPVFPQIRQATYIEMTSTGSLALIPEEQRLPVIQYYETLDWQERVMPRATGLITAPWWYDLPSQFFFDPSFEVPTEVLRRVVLQAPQALQSMRREQVEHRYFVMLMEQMRDRASETLDALSR